MANWLVIDDTSGVVQNVVVYDGTTEYDPGPGMMLLPWDEEARPWIGWRKTESGWEPPVSNEGVSG